MTLTWGVPGGANAFAAKLGAKATELNSQTRLKPAIQLGMASDWKVQVTIHTVTGGLRAPFRVVCDFSSAALAPSLVGMPIGWIGIRTPRCHTITLAPSP